MKRKSEKEIPRCPKCHTGGYRVSKAPDGRPEFTCTQCSYYWTCGKDGGKYIQS
jgi:hypothetical protein